MSEAHAESSPARQSLIKANPFRGTVVISGASRGLGAELVAHACELGYFVFALVRGSTPANTENICFVSVDLSSEPSIEQVILQ
jgi:NAD(P)-dependent dehydrogenase (short-subunit alcohol dehydrogenase family)